MARQRKMWRFRTGDSTIVEVSAAPDATRTQIRRRGRWSLVVGMLFAILAVGALTASGAEVVTAEVTGTTNDVTVTKGGVAVPSNIDVYATGAIDCDATAASPSTATVDTSYVLGWDGSAVTKSSSTPSSALAFFSDGVSQGGSGNCGVTWTGAPTHYGVSASFSAGASVPVGDYTIDIKTAETNPSATTGKLGDTTVTTVTVHVVAPTVTNHAPTANAGGPYSGAEGSNISLSGSGSDSDAGDSVASYKWTSSVVSADSGASCSFSSDTAQNPTISCTDDGSYQVSLTVKDSHGAESAASTANLTVSNANPTATQSFDSSVNEGSSFSLALTGGSDPGSNDTLSYQFDCGDGSGYGAASTTATTTCSTTDNGSRDVKAKILDDDGGSTEYTGSVTVNNVAPTATFNAQTSVNEGSNISLSLTSPYDPSSADTTAGFTYAFDCGDGGGYGSFGSTSTASCSTTDNGSRTVKGKIKDKDGGVTEYTANVTINNVAPTVSALTLGSATGTACTTGNTVTLDFSFSDPGVNDNPWAVDINWGDGAHTTYNASSQGAQTQRSHSYGVGSFTISVSVTDKDGGTGSNSSAAGAVSHLYNMSGILAPFNSDGSSVWKYGSTIPVKVQITDCNGQPVSGLAPQVGTTLSSSTDPTVSIDETASTSAADTTGVMRYDPTAGQYIYNFGSKYLPDPSATYYMTVKGTDSNGNIVTNPPMVQQKFGLKSK